MRPVIRRRLATWTRRGASWNRNRRCDSSALASRWKWERASSVGTRRGTHRRRRVADLQATAPSPTPTRAEEHIATTPDCRPRRASRPRPRRLAPKITSPRAPAPLAHADARRGTPRRDAGLQTSRPRRQSARKMSRNCPGPAAPTTGFERSKSAWRDDEEAVRVGLTGCARDQPCASWGSRLPASRFNDRRLGLALVVKRSGKARGSAGRDYRLLQKKHAAEDTMIDRM
jgi:hypothetical protein